MKLSIHKDPNTPETEIIIHCQEVDARLKQLMKHIRQYTYTLQGKSDDRLCLIPAEKIYYIESVDNRTYLYSAENIYNSSHNLSELESKLDGSTFTRISKCCIINTAYLDYNPLRLKNTLCTICLKTLCARDTLCPGNLPVFPAPD